MATFKLVLEYEGTRYSGWQAQGNTPRTVQGHLTRAAEQLLGKADIAGSGRTDAGVHAAGQVAHLRTRQEIAPLDLMRKLNDLIPQDIHILRCDRVQDGFHARHDAGSRVYLYQISKRRSAFAKPFIWWIKDRLNVESMRHAAALLPGRHDFTAFSDKRLEAESTDVVVERVDLGEDGDLILLRITASHYLWKMVRKIVAALVEVGRGSLSVDGFQELLGGRSERFRPTAPPSGLFLEAVTYEGELFDRPLEAIVPVVTTAPRASAGQKWASRKRR